MSTEALAKLPAYNEPSDKWEAIAHSLSDAQQAPSAPEEPVFAVEWPCLRPGEQSPPPVDVLRAVLSALDRDGVCMIRNALPADVPLTIHAQMEPHLAARAESVGLNKQSAGDSGRRSGSVLSRSRASWGAALHPLVLDLCAGILGRQVLTKSRAEMQSELFFSEPQSTRDSGKNRFRQHPFQLDFTGVVEVAPCGGAEQDLHLDTGKHIFEFRQVLDASITVLWPLTPFNAVNGATRVAKGSHRWDLKRAPTNAEVTPATMEPGSCIIFRGGLFHGAGSNHTTQTRAALVLCYSLGWLRQEENQYLANPIEVVRNMPPELQRLIGFGKAGNSLGFVEWGDDPVLSKL